MNPINAYEYEIFAKKKLNQSAFDYISSGAGDEITLSRNFEAFKSYLVVPRVLRDVSKIDTQVSLLKHELSMPTMIAPTAFHCLAHPQGEIATIKAASNLNVGMVVSSMSTISLEDIALDASCPRWFQLYMYVDREIVLDLIRRAELAGYSALVVTVDVPIMGCRERDIRNQFALPKGLSAKNFERYGAHVTSANKDGSKIKNYTDELFDRSFTWKDIEWIKENTKLPIILKGIMHESDAKLALDMQVNAIIVSNHGGRQLDSMPSTIEILPKIVKALNKRLPLMIDGGFRRGIDIVKAIALGVDCILIGRPILWALACDGQRGVEKILEIYQRELAEAMTLSGCKNIDELKKLDIFSVAR